MDEEKQTVVLAAGQGVVLMADFLRREAMRGRKSKVTDFRAVALQPGATFLHQLDFEWTHEHLEQKASVPVWQALPMGEAVVVLSAEVLMTLENDIYEGTDTEGFMTGESQKVTFHFVTPAGQTQLTLRYWKMWNAHLGRLNLVYDPLRSESA